MARAQIFTFDVIIAVSAFLLILLLITSISRPGVSQGRQETFLLCLSGIESLKANSTLSLVGNGTKPESLLNASLSSFPARFGYELNVTTYLFSGAKAKDYYGISGNLTDAENRGDIVSVESSFVTDNTTPLMGSARLRCWVGK
ncbi:MAG: hypothetical protein V1909_05660 [Candidatus Micrarchaeota archaeon]